MESVAIGRIAAPPVTNARVPAVFCSILALLSATANAHAQEVRTTGNVNPSLPVAVGSWGIAGDLRVGDSNRGGLSIRDGGLVSNTSGYIGYGTGAGGSTVTVSGRSTGGVTAKWRNSADVFVGVDASATLTVSSGGEVLTNYGAGGLGIIHVGQNIDGQGTINIGAAAAATAEEAGSLYAAAIEFGAGSGALNFNHTGTISLAAELRSIGAGTHALNHISGTTTLAGNAATFSGLTTVSGGTLLVGGGVVLGGAVHVDMGGTLGGSGTLAGAVTIDGTLSAGNSPGTLTFNDDLTLNAGSTSVFELNNPGVVGGAGNDLVRVNGDLTLGGTLDARVAAAGYYRLFEYSGAQSGTFSSGTVTGTGGFIAAAPSNPDIRYDTPGQINLSVLGAGQTMQFWDGAGTTANGSVNGGSGTWQSFATNWTDASGTANSGWGGSVGVFSGAPGVVTVQGTQAFDTLQFITDGYRIEGGALSAAVAGGGTFNVDGGVTATIASTVQAGAGNLIRKAGNGTLALTGANSYGDTHVLGGTLIGNTGSITGNISNAANVVFDQASAASFAGNIGGLGGADGTMVKRGAGTLTLSGNSALDWSIEAGGLITNADHFSGDAQIDSGTSLTFTQGSAATYAGVLSGAGVLNISGLGTVTLTGDSSAFTGTTAFSNGSLVVGSSGSGALGGSVTIGSGGLLGGTGAIGSVGSTVTVSSGGVHAPGNSIGVQNVAGDYVNRGVLRIEATPTAADKIVVAGNVDISGAALELVLSPATVASWDIFNGPFTIIDKTSAGAVVGNFAQPYTQNLLFLDALVAYDGGDGNDVTLSLQRNSSDFASVAHTRNQIATATALDSLDNSYAVWRSLTLTTDADTARASFDALSGEIHASARSALIEDSRFVRNAMNERVRAASGDVGASVAPILAYGPGSTPILAAADHPDAAVWSHGFGALGATRGDGNAVALDRHGGGMLIGADGPLGDWRAGVLAGYSRMTFAANGRDSSGASDAVHLGLYGGTEWGNVVFRGGTALSLHSIDTRRSVAIQGLSESLSASYTAATIQTFGELGYGFELGENMRVEPFVNLAHVGVRTNGFAESAGAAALSGRPGGSDVTFATIGVRGEHAAMFGGVEANFSGMLGWRHALGDVTPTSTHAFSGGNAFAIAGAPIARDSLVVETGLDLAFSPDARFGLSYSGQLAADAQDHGFKASLSVKF